MRTVVCCLFLAALAASGCWPHAPFSMVQPPPTAQAAGAAPPALRSPVTPEQVNATNAREMAQALWEEVDREQAARNGKE
jgi:hypothetical protein